MKFHENYSQKIKISFWNHSSENNLVCEQAEEAEDEALSLTENKTDKVEQIIVKLTDLLSDLMFFNGLMDRKLFI